MASTRPHSLRLIRAKARAPRIAFIAAVTVLALGGVRSVVAPRVPPAAKATTTVASADLAAQALAEDFTRAFLAGPEDEEPVPWSDHPAAGEARLWTSIVADSPAGRGRRVITVAARDKGSLSYVAVTVRRGADRRLSVAGPPALVGPPPTDRQSLGVPETEVEEVVLRNVVTRVVRHYVGRERQDLEADLDRGTRVTLPSRGYRVASTDAITWSAPGRRVAVAVTARDSGDRELDLRYELSVVRRAGRWFVRAVHVDQPPPKEQIR